LRIETLEPRLALAAVPFGALPDDTAEFMLGDVYVTVVLMESNDQISVDNNNSENWTAQSIAAVKSKVTEGLQWWTDTLAGITDKHELTFHIDFTHADNPVSTPFEPIINSSEDYKFWIYDFLRSEINTTGTFTTDVRAFNHQQRVENNTHWAFTIFVVNDEHDADHQFASGGLDRAFAFPGGLFLVTLASRPASTIAHETGHIFWALDEYQFGGTANQSRGYYDTPNSNAWNGTGPRQPSIMDRGACEDPSPGLLCTAWQQHTSSRSSLEMLGWRDSDSDGIFDVLDVPHTLTGSGEYDPALGRYRFRGESSVQTLPNLNPRGESPSPTESLQGDITINQISRAQYRIDGGAWQTAATYGGYTTTLDLSFPVPASASLIEIRTIDDTTGVSSPIFQGSLTRPTSTQLPGINGFVFQDDDRDGSVETGEDGLAGRLVRLVDASGQPITLQKKLEPDDYASNTVLQQVVPGVTVKAIGSAVANDVVVARSAGQGSTGTRVFGACTFVQGGTCSIYATEWTTETRHLRMDFSTPVSTISLDALGVGAADYGRLEIYDASNQLLARHTTALLASGVSATMTLSRPTADIAYAIARGYGDTAPRFDNLRFGPETAAVTDAQGAYSIPYLAAGNYLVQAVNDAGSTPTGLATQSVSVLSGSAALADFGFIDAVSPWQNQQLPNDVNNDGSISPLDALLIINNLNAFGPRQLTPLDATPPFLDVSGDGFVSPIDVLRIVNAIEDAIGGEGEAEASSLRLVSGARPIEYVGSSISEVGSRPNSPTAVQRRVENGVESAVAEAEASASAPIWPCHRAAATVSRDELEQENTELPSALELEATIELLASDIAAGRSQA